MLNMKVRFKNPIFIFQLFLSAALPVLAYMGISYDALTSWERVWDVITVAYSNPYVLGLVIVGVYNALIDPVTRGHSDSEQAMKYDKPK